MRPLQARAAAIHEERENLHFDDYRLIYDQISRFSRSSCGFKRVALSSV
jgi:hypothetical protein